MIDFDEQAARAHVPFVDQHRPPGLERNVCFPFPIHAGERHRPRGHRPNRLAEVGCEVDATMWSSTVVTRLSEPTRCDARVPIERADERDVADVSAAIACARVAVEESPPSGEDSLGGTWDLQCV